MSVQPNDPVEPETSTDAGPGQPPGTGTITVPRWVILVTFAFGWGSGGTIVGFELAGQGRLSVMVLGAWLITLPLVASNPFSALRELLGGVLGGTKK